MKICRNCKEEKELENFGKRTREVDGYHYNCKVCCKIERENPIKKQYQKDYQQNHLEQRIIDHQKWKSNNKEDIKVYLREYNRYRYQNDPIFKQNNVLRVAFNDFSKKGIKSKSVMKLLGCSDVEFNEWIKSQFLPGMTEENHGKIWEYDHEKPVSSFDPNKIEDHEECWNYKNIKPRFKTSEIAKQFNSDQIGNKNKGSKYLY